MPSSSSTDPGRACATDPGRACADSRGEATARTSGDKANITQEVIQGQNNLNKLCTDENIDHVDQYDHVDSKTFTNNMIDSRMNMQYDDASDHGFKKQIETTNSAAGAEYVCITKTGNRLSHFNTTNMDIQEHNNENISENVMNAHGQIIQNHSRSLLADRSYEKAELQNNRRNVDSVFVDDVNANIPSKEMRMNVTANVHVHESEADADCVNIDKAIRYQADVQVGHETGNYNVIENGNSQRKCKMPRLRDSEINKWLEESVLELRKSLDAFFGVSENMMCEFLHQLEGNTDKLMQLRENTQKRYNQLKQEAETVNVGLSKSLAEFESRANSEAEATQRKN